jgi:hypothetical protein
MDYSFLTGFRFITGEGFLLVTMITSPAHNTQFLPNAYGDLSLRTDWLELEAKQDLIACSQHPVSYLMRTRMAKA